MDIKFAIDNFEEYGLSIENNCGTHAAVYWQGSAIGYIWKFTDTWRSSIDSINGVGYDDPRIAAWEEFNGRIIEARSTCS